MTTLTIKDYTKRTQSTLRRIVLGSIALLLAAPLYAATPQTHRQECKDDARAKETAFYKGADISWVTEMEAKGYSFANARGEARECTALMKELGLQAIRLRVWVNPQDGFCGTEDVVNKALRAQKLGMDVLIDFHYSDSWADPSKQYIPAAWKNHTYAQILDDVKQHTTGVLQALKAAGVSPKWVQVGNETSDGLLWEVGRASKQAAQYAGIIDAGYAAVKSVFADALVLVHLDNGFNQDLYKWNLNLLKQYGARFDMVGMSLYPDAAVKYNNEQNVSAAIDHCMQNIAFVEGSADRIWLYNGRLISFRSPRTPRLLHILADNPRVTNAELSSQLGINTSAVQKQLTTLSKKGYIVKDSNPKRWRVIALPTTSKGGTINEGGQTNTEEE